MSHLDLLHDGQITQQMRDEAHRRALESMNEPHYWGALALWIAREGEVVRQPNRLRHYYWSPARTTLSIRWFDHELRHVNQIFYQGQIIGIAPTVGKVAQEIRRTWHLRIIGQPAGGRFPFERGGEG